MRKFFNGIKDRLSINDPQSEPAAVPPLPNIYGRPYRQFPDTEDMDPNGAGLPQAWIDALDAAIKAGKIPDVPVSQDTGGNPIYPNNLDPLSPEICSSTYKCRNDDDLWDAPDGGLHGYLVRFLEAADSTFQHIAVWTLVQLLEAGDADLERRIRSSSDLVPLVTRLESAEPEGGADDDDADVEEV